MLMGTKRFAALIAAVALAWTYLAQTAGPAAANSNTCEGRPCIQVGAFNVEWLGTRRRNCEDQNDPRTCWPLRSHREVTQIADLFTQTLDLEVVALVEINTGSQQFRWLKEIAAERGYEARWEGDAMQNVVLLWRTDRVDLQGTVAALDVRTSFQLSGGCRSSNLRAPLAAQFRAGAFEFVVLAVHLKAQIGGDCADRVRAEQAKDIVAKLSELRARDKDIIVIGDFNAELNDASLKPLFDAGFGPLTTSRNRSPTSANVSYLKDPYRNVIDHLMILPASERDWVARSTTIFQAPTEPAALTKYLRHISDHAPVWASFFTDTDSD